MLLKTTVVARSYLGMDDVRIYYIDKDIILYLNTESYTLFSDQNNSIS